MPKKVMIYAATVAPGGVETFTSRISTALEHALPDADWQLSILGKPNNSLQQPINWPKSAFKALVQPEKSTLEEPSLNADLREFRQLADENSPSFDVLYLPSPWGNIPLGSTLPIPAPVVMSIHDLEFEDVDYGSITDQYRKEAQKFAKLGSAFVFSSEYVRERAITLYGFPRERTHVVHQAPTVSTAPPTTDIRQKYGLPEKYMFSLSWLSRRKNGGVLIEALGILKAKGLPSLPLVTAGYSFDDVLPENIAHRQYGEQVRARISELGLTDVYDLGVVDQADIPALIGGAMVVIAPSKSEAGLSYLILDTMALGTPLIHARIPAVIERLGTDNTYSLSFDPNDPQELAKQITDVLTNETAARARAEKARAFISERTQEDVAREYLDIFKSVSESPWETRPRQRDHVMRSREERVAWLMNHTTLRDSEVPMMCELGLEVYTSKEVPAAVGVSDQTVDVTRSMSVDFSEDENSTLPNWVLNRLNRHNFYNDGIPPDIASLLNGYFGTIITTSGSWPLLNDLVDNFSGRIILRVFGREHPATYSFMFNYFGQAAFWKKLWQIQHRFWFGPAYDSIAPIEVQVLQDRSITLPLSLPDRTWRAANQWVGTDKRILFFCPRIASVPAYYGKIYEEFKSHLGHLPHLIAGHQPLPVDDPNVTGYVSDDQMQSWYRELRVMFYHSSEPRHLHYHPLEAVVYGMPLIYMKGGLVEELIGKETSGGCDTYEEAEQKLQRILNGDEAFTCSVIESQSSLLDTFQPDYVRQIWKERFLNNVMNISYIPDVLPFAQWKPLEKKPLPPTPIPSKTGRRIGVYVLMWAFGGVNKYITGLLDTATSLVESSNWQFDLIWGSPLIGEHDYPPLKWEYQSHSNLHFKFLTDPPVILKTAKDFYQPAVWRKSRIYLNNRPIRIISEALIFPSEYIYEAFRQRRLRPTGTQLYKVLNNARIGKRALGLPGMKNLFIDEPDEITVDQVNDFLANQPKPSKIPKLRVSPSPPYRWYLKIGELKRIAAQYEALLMGNPFRLISPNTPIKGLKRQPVAITMYDLAHEFTEVWGADSHSISREMVLWGKLAQIVVFGSEYIRDEAVKRYDIPFENTRIIRPSPLVIRWDAPQREEIERIKTKLGLPEHYLFNTGHQGTHKNNIAIFQAMQILRWRGFNVPPLVLGGAEAQNLLVGVPRTDYLAVLQKMIADGYWEIGKDLIIVDFISEDDLPAIYGGATIGISMSRSESTVHGMITESMLYGAPVICSSIPQNTEELGPNGDVALIVPLDDPVALADAIEYTLNNPEETKARVERASVFIGKKTWRKMAQEFLEIFEEIAASRTKR